MYPILYSSPACAPCNQVKRWLQANNIAYETRTLEQAIQDGFTSLPILIYRDQIYRGPTLDQLKEIFPA